MNNKKIIFSSIVIVVLLILIISGATYAYFMAATDEVSVGAQTGKIDINYVGPTGNLTGTVVASDNRNSGIIATASAYLNDDSEDVSFRMFITPTVLTGLDIEAFKWEVEGIRGGTIVEECSSKGNFSGATVNNKVMMLSDCPLSTVQTTFNIYIWLDGSILTEALSGVSFQAKIGADSANITGQFE